MILKEEEILLSDEKLKLVESGWGSEVVNDVIVKKIIYDSDEIEVEGFLAHPKDINKKYPLIIWNRGGNHKAGLIDDFLAKGILGEISSWGYIVLASQYRKNEEFGGKDVNDILNLISVAETLSYCDTSRIGMEGWSRGGMMAYKVLTKTDKIKTCIVISGLADLIRNEKMRNDLGEIYKILFGTENENEFLNRKKERSAVNFANEINKKTSMLLIHGTDDKKISYQDSIDMYNKLLANDIQCELELIEGGDHYLKRHKKIVRELRKNWFEKNLLS